MKNSDAAHVSSVCQELRGQSGRVLRRKWPHARTATPSLQGLWNPAFNYTPPLEQMKKAVERETRMLGVEPPLSAAAQVPPPPSLLIATPPSASSSSSPSSQLPPSPPSAAGQRPSARSRTRQTRRSVASA